MNRAAAREGLLRAQAELDSAAERIQAAAELVEGPYRQAAVLAAADAAYARNRVKRIVQLLGAGAGS